MSKIEVIEKTVQDIGGIANYYGGLLAAKTECGGYAWTIEDYDGESWQLIPESLYLELVKFNSAHIQIGDKVRLNALGVKAIIDNSRVWCGGMLANLLAENRGIIAAISLSDNLLVVEFSAATFYLSPEMVDKIGGDV